MSILKSNFQVLVALGIYNPAVGSVEQHKVSRSLGFMDLVVERNQMYDHASPSSGVALSLTHYHKVEGDLVCDPDMVILVRPEVEEVEALTFQMDLPPIYQVVYDENGQRDEQLFVALNDFLGDWLHNLQTQGFGRSWEISE